MLGVGEKRLLASLSTTTNLTELHSRPSIYLMLLSQNVEPVDHDRQIAGHCEDNSVRLHEVERTGALQLCGHGLDW